MNSKKSITGLGIIGFVFSLLGGIFLLVGIIAILSLQGQEIAIMGYVFTPVGALFFILGMIFLVWKKKQAKRKEALRKAGHYVMATVDKVVCNYNIRYNNMYPYVVYCNYVDEQGKKHCYRSANILFNPKEMLCDNQVRVFVEPDNLRHYEVDLDSILPNIVLHTTTGFQSKNLGMRVCGIIFTIIGAVFIGISLIVLWSVDTTIDNSILLIIFGVNGGTFLVLGIFFLLCEIRKRQIVKRLKSSGTFVYATIKNAVTDATIEYGNMAQMNPCYFQCSYSAPNGVEHLFRSESKSKIDQENYIGRQVKVYYDGEDFRKYYVALEEMPY